ncbi:hypothetical protein JQ604_18025 [Bradyrhizobium jicamae]|uniref:hypothetical protein n=1 Tax=Bradyrhizobium jicamae TaxID=280332 RepID=UPI001BA6AA73|nr:hypothetical protein [Bradyrhizobium jicamae]MBR0754085.1 hypothetical protein [Bradyrhizobium jicamae]
MPAVIVKRQPKRRCHIPKRPHPDIEFFFNKYDRKSAVTSHDDGTGFDGIELDDQLHPPNGR